MKVINVSKEESIKPSYKKKKRTRNFQTHFLFWLFSTGKNRLGLKMEPVSTKETAIDSLCASLSVVL